MAMKIDAPLDRRNKKIAEAEAFLSAHPEPDAVLAQGEERAAEVLAIYNAYGSEFWALSRPHFKILRACARLANFRGGCVPNARMVALVTKKIFEMVNPEKINKLGEFSAIYEPEEAAQKVEWFSKCCYDLGLDEKNGLRIRKKSEQK